MRGGFTFKNVHSSVYGIKETPTNRILSPLKRRSLISIPGRSRAIIQEDGGYDSRVESILCSYAKQDGVDIHKQVRRIAGWLDGIGELTFDYEPTLHYNAFLSSEVPTVTMLEFAQFELQFTINHPFAYETAIQQLETISALNVLNDIEIMTEGTVETPVRIIIKNQTNQTITDLKLYHHYVEDIEA